MEPFSRRRWTAVPTPSVSYSVQEIKKIASGVSASFINMIYHGASMVVHLLLHKFSMTEIKAMLRRFKALFRIFSYSIPLWPSQAPSHRLRRPERKLKINIYSQFRSLKTCARTRSVILQLESTAISVTILGDFLHSGQLFKAFGNNEFAQISHILGNFCKRFQNLSFF